MGGIGERAGNTPLEEVAALLTYKGALLGLHTDIDVAAMYEAYTALRAAIGLEEPRNKAIFGTYAFGTAGRHPPAGHAAQPGDVRVRGAGTLRPSTRSLLIGRHSGRAVLRHILDELEIVVSEEDLAGLYRTHIAERTGGDCEDISVVKARLARELKTRLPAAA